MSKDKHVKSVVKKFKNRSKVGIKKYGTTLERPDYFFIDWVTHLQEELMDASLYCEVLKSQFETASVDVQNVQGSSVEPTIEAEIKQQLVISQSAVFEDGEMCLEASWGEKFFYGIEITLKGKRDEDGIGISFYWDNALWLYRLAFQESDAVKEALEDLTEKETEVVVAFLKELVGRGILKGKEEGNIHPF